MQYVNLQTCGRGVKGGDRVLISSMHTALVALSSCPVISQEEKSGGALRRTDVRMVFLDDKPGALTSGAHVSMGLCRYRHCCSLCLIYFFLLMYCTFFLLIS